MDLDALEAELEAQMSHVVIANSRPHISSYQKTDPYGMLSFGPPKPPRVPPPRLTAEQKMMKGKGRHVDSQYAPGTIERLEEEMMSTGKEAGNDEDDDDAQEIKRPYPKLVARDVRHRIRVRGYSEEALRKIEDYMEEGWRLQAIINRKREENDAKKSKKKRELAKAEGGEGEGNNNNLSLPLDSISEGGDTMRFGVTPRTPGRLDTARSGAGGEGGGDGNQSPGRSSAGSSPKSETARLLNSVTLDEQVLSMLLRGSDKTGDVRVLPKVDPEAEKKRVEAEEQARRKAEGIDGDEEEEHHRSIRDLKDLMLMAGVKMLTIQQTFDRFDLEEILADRLIELYEASIVALRIARHGLAQLDFKANKERWAADDKAVTDLQRFIRFSLYFRQGQQQLQDIRREVRLQDLGADATVLTLLAQAKDGDIIVIPKGDHYVKATELIKTCETSTETKLYVACADSLRPGGDVVVGKEACTVVTIKKGIEVEKGVKGDEVVVKRYSPAILWEFVLAEKDKVQRALERIEKLIKQGKGSFKNLPDPTDHSAIKKKVMEQWNFCTEDAKLGMLENDWVALVREVLGPKRDPEIKSSFRWLAGASEGINLVVTLLNAINGAGPSNDNLTEGDVANILQRWWKAPFRTGMKDAGGSPVTEIPAEKMSETLREDVGSVLLEEVRSGEAVSHDAALDYLRACTFDGMRRGRIVSRERFLAVLEGLHEGCEFVTAHDEGSVVRAEGRVEVKSIVEIIGEPGTVIHGCLALGESQGALYVRPIPNLPSQVLRLINDVSADGERTPRQLIDIRTDEVVWSRDLQSMEYLEVLLESCQKQRGTVKGLTVQSGTTDSVRVEGGEWDVVKCRFVCCGSASDALVCGRGAHVHAKRCQLGGVDQARECRNVMSVLENATIKATGCLLASGMSAAMRFTINSSCVLEKCMLRGCGSALDGYGASNGKVEMMDNKLEGVRQLWADSTHRPLRGQVLELNNVQAEEEVVFNDWRRAEWEKEAARLREAIARKAQREKDEAQREKASSKNRLDR